LTSKFIRFSIASLVGKGEFTQLAERLRSFARDRDWDRFHTPKNLAASVAIEAAELQEVFQWLTDSEAAILSPDQLAKVREELADVAIYAIRLADRLGIDLPQAIDAKIIANEVRYPAEAVRGTAAKRP